MQAVHAAKQAWGERKLEELEAEERLAFACERAHTSDEVTLQLRSAFKVCQQKVACASSLIIASRAERSCSSRAATARQHLWPPRLLNQEEVRSQGCFPLRSELKMRPGNGAGVQGRDRRGETGCHTAGRLARRRHREARGSPRGQPAQGQIRKVRTAASKNCQRQLAMRFQK